MSDFTINPPEDFSHQEQLEGIDVIHNKKLLEKIHLDIERIGSGNEKIEKIEKIDCETNILFNNDIEKSESSLLHPIIIRNFPDVNKRTKFTTSYISSTIHTTNILQKKIKKLAENAIINYGRSKTFWRYTIEHKDTLNQAGKLRSVHIDEWKRCELYSNLSYKFKKLSENQLSQVYIGVKDLIRCDKVINKFKETNEIPNILFKIWPPYIRFEIDGNNISQETRKQIYKEKEEIFKEELKQEVHFTDSEIEEYLNTYNYRERDGYLRYDDEHPINQERKKRHEEIIKRNQYVFNVNVDVSVC